MLKRIAIGILIFIATLTIAVWATHAHCWGCPTYKCYGADSCGDGCYCLTEGLQVGGRCVSLEK